jgi:hypothetical protein
VNDERIRFYNITTTTGITKAITYFIVGKTDDTFQVSLTQGGGAVALTTNGTGSFYPTDKFKLADTIGGSAKALTTNGTGSVFVPLYRQAIITVVPQGAGSTFTTIDIGRRHTSASAVNLSVPWLDVTVCGGSLTGIISRSTTQESRNIEQFKIVDHGYNNAAMTTFSTLTGLVSVPLFDASKLISISFGNCFSLRTIPPINTASMTSMASMFSSCYALVSIPTLDTSLVTSIANCFNTCVSLIAVPLINTSSVSAATSAFNACTSLQAMPALDYSAVTATGTMFAASDAIGRIEGRMPAVSFSVASLNLGAAALDEIYTNLPTATATITVTGNYGVGGDDPTIATAKGWTVDG